jgi:Transposase
MRFIALDVHRDFCEIAIAEAGEVRLVGRVKTEPEALELFARSLAASDRVALEASGNGLAIARIIEPHVDRVLLANPKAVKGVTQTAKTDKIDARTLAQLLAGGFLPEVWIVDEPTRMLRRRVARRAQLVRQRTREKNTGARDPGSRVGGGWPSRRCPKTSARRWPLACATSTSSRASWHWSTGAWPSTRSPQPRCSG